MPSAVAFLAFGDVIAAALLQTGRFRNEDAVYVWGILAGSALGLLASTLGRLYSSSYYALHDTRTPLAFAVVRIGVGTVLGYFLAVHAPAALGIPRVWGAAGLTLSASLAGWIELLLLRRALNARLGRTGLPASYVATLWLLAIASAAASWGVRSVLPPLHPAIAAAAILGPVRCRSSSAARCCAASRRRGRWCGASGHGVDRRSRFNTETQRHGDDHGEDRENGDECPATAAGYAGRCRTPAGFLRASSVSSCLRVDPWPPQPP